MTSSKKILKQIILKGGLYGAIAQLDIDDNEKAHQFIIECFEQCHNESIVEFLGIELTQSITDYRWREENLACLIENLEI